MSFKYNNIFNLECCVMFVDVCDKDFWDAVVGWGFSLQNRITRQSFPTPSKCQQCKDALFRSTDL